MSRQSENRTESVPRERTEHEGQGAAQWCEIMPTNKRCPDASMTQVRSRQQAACGELCTRDQKAVTRGGVQRRRHSRHGPRAVCSRRRWRSCGRCHAQGGHHARRADQAAHEEEARQRPLCSAMCILDRMVDTLPGCLTSASPSCLPPSTLSLPSRRSTGHVPRHQGLGLRSTDRRIVGGCSRAVLAAGYHPPRPG